MILKKLDLQSFRSFKKKSFIFSDKTTLIIGPNTAGKTNIVEAIYLLVLGKSFRAFREQEMIRYGEEMALIQSTCLDARRAINNQPASTQGGQSTIKLEIILTAGEVQGKKTARKLYKVNGVGKRRQDFIGKLKCVLFRPEDIDLVLGTPSIRRNYLDSVLEQVDWQYRSCNLTYKKGMRQRNKLLDKIREGVAKRSQLTFWDRLLVKNGRIITEKRDEMIEFFNRIFSGKLEKSGRINTFYDKSVISENRLEKYAQAEIALGSTLIGPHRDDIRFEKFKSLKSLKDGKNLALYGSRGEQRMAVLNLKLAELEFITGKTEQKPVLLLDDIFSELDKENRKLVLEIINSCQTIITGTDAVEARNKSIIRL